jgi:hypothetical protein
MTHFTYATTLNDGAGNIGNTAIVCRVIVPPDLPWRTVWCAVRDAEDDPSDEWKFVGELEFWLTGVKQTGFPMINGSHKPGFFDQSQVVPDYVALPRPNFDDETSWSFSGAKRYAFPGAISLHLDNENTIHPHRLRVVADEVILRANPNTINSPSMITAALLALFSMERPA